MPIPQETVAETVTAVDTTDLPKIKEKALPTSTTEIAKPAAAEAEEPKAVEEQPKEKVEEKEKPISEKASEEETLMEEKKETPAPVANEGETNTDSDVPEKAEKPTKELATNVPAAAPAPNSAPSEENGKADEVKDTPAPTTAEEKNVEAGEKKEKVNGGKVVATVENGATPAADKQGAKVDEEQKEAEKPCKKSSQESAATEAPKTPVKSAETDQMATSTTETPDLTPKKAEAFNLLAQGKRHYLVKDYESAVETLGEVCPKFVEIYGEHGTELADVYYYYGISLLELAREETNLLSVDKKDEEEEDEDEDEEMEQEEEEEGKGSGKKMPEDEEEEEKKDTENPSASASGDDPAVKPADDSVADSSVAADETLKEGETTMEDDEGEVNNLQLAWEVLELARNAYHRVNNELKLADVYLKLSEVSMESENYAAAIEDIEKGLAIYSVKLEKDARQIAEAYYKLGMAHASNDNYPEALNNFKLSRETLMALVENLKNSTKPDGELSKDPFYKKENEIKELEALLPELNARIEDCSSDNKEIQKVISKFISGGRKPAAGSDDGAGPSSAPDSAGASSAASSSCKPASDISHLVKKKRKPEEDIEKPEVEGKKIKLDESSSATKEQESKKSAEVSDDVEMKETVTPVPATDKTEADTDKPADKKTEEETKDPAPAPAPASSGSTD